MTHTGDAEMSDGAHDGVNHVPLQIQPDSRA
jgi:hypothetical protein